MPINYDTGNTYDSTSYEYNGDLNQPIVGLPIVGVFFAPDNTPYDANPTWVEITNYVRRATINRGRGNDYEQFRTATASVTLDNLSRMFDPFNTAGIYYGKLTPRTPIKIVAQANNTNYTIFRGYVAGFPVEWTDNGYDSTVTVDCFDLFGLMASTKQPLDWSYETITTLNPRHYWRGDDPAGSPMLTDRGSAPSDAMFTSYIASQTQKTDTLGKGLNFQAPSAFEGYFDSSQVVIPVQTAITFGGFIKSNYVAGWSGTSSCGHARIRSHNLYVRFFLEYSSSTSASQGLVFDVRLNSETRIYRFTNITPSNSPIHCAVTIDVVTSDVHLYVNGQEISTTYTTSTLGYDTWEGLSVWLVAAQELFCFDYVLTASQIASIYGAGIGNIAETTASRASRILGTTDIPSSMYQITSTPVGTVSEITNGGNALPQLQTVANSEGGELFVNRDGVIQFVDRWYSFGNSTSAVVQATFGETDIQYSDTFELRYDADSIRNVVNLQFAGGGEVTSINTTSANAYGRADEQIITVLADIDQAQSLATLETTIGGVLKPTVGAIQVGTVRDTLNEWAAILGLDVLHRIRVKRTPSTGSAFEQDMLINNITYGIEADRWSVTIEGSARLTGWFTSDYSLTDGSDVVL